MKDSYVEKIKELKENLELLFGFQARFIKITETFSFRYEKLFNYIHANKIKLISSHSSLISEVSDVSNRWLKLKEEIDFFQMSFTVFNSQCDILMKHPETITDAKPLEQLLADSKTVKNMIEVINQKTEYIFEIISRAEKLMLAEIN